ncbi:MAG: TrmB family transcriptional regulator [Haloferacaceae archaeon]
MSTDNVEEAVDILQELGLKEYEARCFVGLSRTSTATAKQLGEITDVPRTRVYDAIRVLETKGLVEIQHTSPQQFRAMSLEEATETLREQYEGRVDRLRGALERIERAEAEPESPVQEVWSLSGREAIVSRTNQLLQNADEEVMFVIGAESLLTADLVERLNGLDGGVDLIVGAATDRLDDRIRDQVTSATTFVSGLDWLHGPPEAGDDHGVAVGRLLLIDKSTILVSSIVPTTGEEHAVFGTGFGNSLVVIARRLMAQGLMDRRHVSEPRDE